MDAGTTFLRADPDKHLWVILSDPSVDADNVLIVNLTTLDERKEKVCVMVAHIVAAGGDADTNTSLAGQVAGTHLGFAALPAHLVHQLPDTSFILEIARRFAATVCTDGTLT